MAPDYSRPEAVKNTRVQTVHLVIALLHFSKQINRIGIKKVS
jgi:hypothetical protein